MKRAIKLTIYDRIKLQAYDFIVQFAFVVV